MSLRLPIERSHSVVSLLANGDGFNLVFVCHVQQCRGSQRTLALWRVRIDYLVVQQRAQLVETYGLASIGKPRVYGQHALLAQWRSEQ